MIKKEKAGNAQKKNKLFSKKKVPGEKPAFGKRCPEDSNEKQAAYTQAAGRLEGCRLSYTVPADVMPKVMTEGVITMNVPPLVLYNATFKYRNLGYLNSIVRQKDSGDVPQDYVPDASKPLAAQDSNDDMEVDIL